MLRLIYWLRSSWARMSFSATCLKSEFLLAAPLTIRLSSLVDLTGCRSKSSSAGLRSLPSLTSELLKRELSCLNASVCCCGDSFQFSDQIVVVRVTNYRIRRCSPGSGTTEKPNIHW